MKFDLAGMMRRSSNPRRAKITLRQIQPTATMAGDLYATAYKPVIEAWKRAVVAIGARYEAAVPEQVKDAAIAIAYGEAHRTKQVNDAVFDLDAILSNIEGSLAQVIIELTPRLRTWAARAELWHRGQWRRAVMAGTGLDPQTMLGAGDVSETVNAFVSRNVQLIRSVSDEARGRISDVVLRGYSARTPLRTVAKEMAGAVDLGRQRALRIASDQNAKLSAGLDRARQEQAGIAQFAWSHSAKKHPRPWHVARNGKVYDWSTLHQVNGPDQIEPGDNAGQPPFCGCRSRAVIDLS